MKISQRKVQKPTNQTLQTAAMKKAVKISKNANLIMAVCSEDHAPIGLVIFGIELKTIDLSILYQTRKIIILYQTINFKINFMKFTEIKNGKFIFRIKDWKIK